MGRAGDFESLVYLAQRGLVTLYDQQLDTATIQSTVVVFFDSDPDTNCIPRTLSRERGQLLANGGAWREWYLVTTDGPTQWTEELRGDFGFLIVSVGDVETAMKVLRTALQRVPKAGAA